jgi:Zn finger protein HypA/HybF involved in hydrogenase expression
MSQPNNSNYVRRVVLPSGRAIEVVYFENTPAEAATPEIQVRTESVDLHVCPECTKGLVYPVEWEEASTTHWEVQLRCPNCEWSTVGLYDQETVDRFDEELDRGTEGLVRDLKRLTRANMEEEVERFSSALASDAIWPMDF